MENAINELQKRPEKSCSQYYSCFILPHLHGEIKLETPLFDYLTHALQQQTTMSRAQE